MNLNIYLFLTILTLLSSCNGHNNSDTIVSNNIAEANANKDTDTTTISTSELTKIYSQAIGDFITAVYKKDKTVYDTLFFGKRKSGLPDDFPDIELPETIQNTQIRLIDPELGKKLQTERKTRIYINMIGWVDKKKAEFIFVVFSNGFEHQFDCYLNYKYNETQKEYVSEKPRIEVLVLNKKGKPDHFAIYEDGNYIGDKPIN